MKRAVNTVLAVWLLLMLATTASTWGFSLSTVAPTISTVAVMVISAIKVGLVMAFFMALRYAPLAWQLAGSMWVVVTTSMLVIIYLQ